MVMEVASRPSVKHTTGFTAAPSRPWSDGAAYRLAAVVTADPVLALAAGARDVPVDMLAARFDPLVAWARNVPAMTDRDAIRRGVILAGTRTLVGVPRRMTLVALHELPATMRQETPAPRRLEALATEVGLRVRRQRRHLEPRVA
jgi:hypothetical protein